MHPYALVDEGAEKVFYKLIPALKGRVIIQAVSNHFPCLNLEIAATHACHSIKIFQKRKHFRCIILYPWSMPYRFN
jgi:hypothetical protein